jgi:hypothetical protein
MKIATTRRRLSDKEAHAAIAVLRYQAGWRDSKPSLRFWGVTPEREPLVLEEAQRLANSLRMTDRMRP